MLALGIRHAMFHTDRHTTPPLSAAQMFYPNSAESNITAHSFFSTGNSPESVLTDITAPSRGGSPPASTSVNRGPLLLPKIRCQDQTTEPTAGPVRHHRTVSANPAFHHFTPYPYGIIRPTTSRRRTHSPEGRSTSTSTSIVGPGISSSAAPASTFPASNNFPSYSNFPSAITKQSALASNVDSPFAVQAYQVPNENAPPAGYNSSLNSPISFNHSHSQSSTSSRRASLAHVRTTSLPPAPNGGHSRSASASSVDHDTVWRHGYPTQYRQIPQYVTAGSQISVSAATASPITQASQSAGPALMMNELPLSFDDTDLSFTFPQETTSLLSYLSSANPAPGLIARSVNDDFHRKNRDWWWWDVRTLRSWTDFNMDTILAIQDFERLLHFPQDASMLPNPARSSTAPDTEHHLRDIYQKFFATKVNAALKATLGENHIFMHAQNSASNNTWPKPDFISNYASDYMKTYHDETRGRLVGLVKPYSVWNTGLRTGDQIQRVQYLHGLSHLHRVMREHRCRYGFIITEIELLCVRMGAKDDEYMASMNRQPGAQDEGPIPWFGYLETANPIQLSTHGLDPETNKPRLTVAIALWYMHMLAKEEPLQGQPGWKLHVGGPAERTRQFRLERDSWIPKAQDGEKRNAKNIRGWVWPEDPFHKKENLEKRRRR
ncbi:uncharacterized protein PV09_01025 [Verruconis gallopava]|uniref:Sialidase n=1 Tax=Verruconis gallopava TaxID=253628 RepID=A0A0D2ANK5_9PEZI|nr:uncharacterized protein PV09_01025 [Verruconis gallopava]KIW08085.1 hypothetical protein PV09_01025 [Verruconis gallopava]